MPFLLPSQTPENDGKMTVILSMDETLFHSIFLQQITANINGNVSGIYRDFKDNADFVVNKFGGIAIFLRPGLSHFLYKLSKLCEVVLWTAAERDYAEDLLNHLDPNGTLLPYRLFREDIVQRNDGKWIKDIQLLGRNIKRTMLIDNDINLSQAFPCNTLLIEDFYGDPNDCQLEVIWLLITELNSYADIRPSLKISLQHCQNLEGAVYDKKASQVLEKKVNESTKCIQIKNLRNNTNFRKKKFIKRVSFSNNGTDRQIS